MNRAMDVSIRSYNPATDTDGLRRCFIALQDHEHEFAPEAPTGADLVDEYLPWMLERCEQHAGVILVADVEGQVAGFAALLTRVERSGPDDPEPFHAFLGEISVLPEYRGQGIGKALLREAERLAPRAGARSLRLAVDWRNEGARRLYEREGFEGVVLVMRKGVG